MNMMSYIATLIKFYYIKFTSQRVYSERIRHFEISVKLTQKVPWQSDIFYILYSTSLQSTSYILRIIFFILYSTSYILHLIFCILYSTSLHFIFYISTSCILHLIFYISTSYILHLIFCSMISEHRGTSSPEEDVSFQNYPHNRRKRDGSICEEDLPPSKRNSFHAVSVKCLIPHQVGW